MLLIKHFSWWYYKSIVKTFWCLFPVARPYEGIGTGVAKLLQFGVGRPLWQDNFTSIFTCHSHSPLLPFMHQLATQKVGQSEENTFQLLCLLAWFYRWTKRWWHWEGLICFCLEFDKSWKLKIRIKMIWEVKWRAWAICYSPTWIDSQTYCFDFDYYMDLIFQDLFNQF